ncbi:diguanylate cyclase (GGDEF) domain-containing protein [Nitrosomonas aestuarii]|uniref:diguanylate cyclase n=1 Tax=Nitrosomonas aestuarii TaxID=52441 RepID=A0A1I4BHG3_9PROT|nr:diguanylate cyclase [Nitrosomonas aestuarii]SFK67459.1 diguanylate cyclase (GGDEF) domain-containing protein [Nitrosomonas aestuarii]
MKSSVTDFQEKMHQLADAFIKELPEKTEDIETMWQQLQNDWNVETLQIVHRKVHGLVGSSKTFGFEELSQIADKLEQALKILLQNKASIDEPQSNEIHLQMQALNQWAHKPKNEHTQIIVEKLNNSHPDSDEACRIFVVDDDQEAAQELALQLSYYGYEVEAFGQLDKFRAAIKEDPNAIVLMNVEFSDDPMAGVRIMKEIKQEMTDPLQVMFISPNDDLATRLEAVRAGGVAYLTKPINSAELIDQLDSFAVPQTQEPFRVLIIDDSTTVLEYHAAVLELSGMVVRAVEKTDAVMKTLLEFNPDLILIDVYMPECSGIELAKVIRQIDGLLSVPIVYLSSENDFNTQLEAMCLAGDDFLVKPIDPKRLVSAVTMRVRRARLLRGLMVRDGLTGLFNHTAIKEQLGREIVRSNRLKTPLSFAMIDVDFFKKVNDTYGHAAGDRVLKSLARLLKQRLRGTDIVGRYGGEEFAVIMTDTNAPEAAKVIDEIRKVFSRLLHMSDNREFKVTFSCGIADIKHFPDVKSVSEAADKALHDAKRKGRNQVTTNADD